MKAIIHIGMVKTGTTSIQTWLVSNRDALEVEGVRTLQGKMPVRAFPYAVFQVAVRDMGVDERTAWPFLDDLSKQRKKISEHCLLVNAELEKFSNGNGVFTFSKESFYKFREVHMIAFDKLLYQYFNEVNYIVYIRDTVELFASRYSEVLRNNYPNKYSRMKFSSLLKNCATDIAPYGISCSLEHLFKWEKVVGDRLQVRLLETDWLHKGDLIEDFASVLGVDAHCKPCIMNESIAVEYIEYVRFLNCEFGESLPKNVRSKAMEIIAAASAGKPKPKASDAQAILIHDIQRDTEERIRKRFFPSRPYLFSPKNWGNGTMPITLTQRRKAKIESEIWENSDIRIGGHMKSHVVADECGFISSQCLAFPMFDSLTSILRK